MAGTERLWHPRDFFFRSTGTFTAQMIQMPRVEVLRLSAFARLHAIAPRRNGLRQIARGASPA